MKLFTMAILVALGSATLVSAKDKDKRILTNEEMQTAYNVAVNKISTMLKAPSTAVYAPIEQTSFKPIRGNSIAVKFYVDAQNSYGAMLREVWSCSVGPQRQDGLYTAWCYGR